MSIPATESPPSNGPADRFARFVGKSVGWFDWLFTPFTSRLLYCGIESNIRRTLGNVLLSGQIALFFGIAWGIVGAELGLTDLFWHEDRFTQFLVGMATCWLFGTVVFVNMLLYGYPLSRLYKLSDRPSDPENARYQYWWLTPFPSYNPGVRIVGWRLGGWIFLLGTLLYFGKLLAPGVGEQLQEKTIGREQPVPQSGTWFLFGYVVGYLQAYVLSFLDARLGFRKALTDCRWLTLPSDVKPCGDAEPESRPESHENAFRTLLLMHAMALVYGIVIFAEVLLVLALIYFFGITVPPALTLALILMTLDVTFGMVAFRVRGARSLAVCFLVYVMLVNWNSLVGNKMSFPNMDYSGPGREVGSPNYYREKINNGQTPANLIETKALLESFKANWQATHKGQKPKLVLIATSGGGIRASVWSGAVLQELDRTGLRDHIRLIAGASGGMVGATGYVGEFQEQPLSADGFDEATGLYPLPKALAEDSLSAVVQTMVVHDFTFGTLSPFPSNRDRGRTLEKVWDQHFEMSTLPVKAPFAIAMRDETRRRREAECRLPILAFTPMLVEDAKRLLISNLDFGPMTDPESPGPEGGPQKLSLPAVEFFRLFPDANGFQVGTAARMSATFPVISPAVGLPIRPVRRVVDAGYFDNYGVQLLCHWLLRYRQEIEQNTSGVLLIQIRAYPLTEEGRDISNVEQSPVDMAIGAVSAPLQALTTARGAAAHHRNSELLDAVHRTFNIGARSNFFVTESFELNEPAALSWYLTTQQKRSIAAGLYQPLNGKWLMESGRPKLRDERARRLEAMLRWFGNGGGP